jgi:tRNA(Arg) A34 adenosine deaminase TadA
MSPDKAFNMMEKIAQDVAPVGAARIAAGVFRRNELIAVGVNSYKSHPFQVKFQRNSDSIFLHAETDAIKNALKRIDVEDLRYCSLIICRVKYDSIQKNNLVWGLAKPCSGCMKAIISYNIRKVYYTCDNGCYERL